MSHAEAVAGTNKWDKYAPGHPGHLSDEQKAIVEEFLRRAPRAAVESVRFQPFESPEHFACRILRARKFSVDDALHLVDQAAEWRTTRRVPELATADPTVLLGGVLPDEIHHFHQKCYFPFRDKEGRHVYLERTGLVDADMILSLTTADHLEEYHIHNQEMDVIPLFERSSRAKGSPVTTSFSILDLEGMSMKLASSIAINYVKRLTAIDAAYYPETLGKMFILNAPGIFTAVWAIIKGFLDERTVRKIEIFGGQSSWGPRLAALVEPDKLPVEYGGTYVVPGGLFKKSRTSHTMVHSGKVMIDVIPLKAGETARVKWMSRPSDIVYGVKFVSGPVPPQFEAHKGASISSKELADLLTAPHDDAVPSAAVAHPDHTWTESRYTAPRDGFLVPVWDNSAGWRQREIIHRWDPVVDGKLINPWVTIVPAEVVPPTSPPATAGGSGAAATGE